MKDIDTSKLPILINDIFDAVERSKIGSVYVMRDNEIVRSPEGSPFVNNFASSVLLTCIQTAIMKGCLDD